MTELAIEQPNLVLEDQLLDHLATAEGAMAVFKDRLDPDVIGEEDQHVRDVLTFVYEFIRKNRAAPGPAVLHIEFGIDFLPPETPVGYVVEKLRERYKRTEMQKVVAKVAKLTNSEPDEAVRFAFNEFSRIRVATMPQKNISVVEDYVERVESYKERVLTRALQGITLGWDEVDEDLGGIRKNSLIALIGRLKQGKSWFLLQSAHKAWLAGNDVAFYTLELSIPEMMDRHLCMLTGVGYGRFMKGHLTHDENAALEWGKQFTAQKFEQGHRIHFLRPDVGDRSVPSMLQQAMELDTEALYIDQLSWIDPTKRFADSRWREVEYTMSELKAATDHLPIYFAAQFNREAASMAEMGDASQIGLSDSIGQTSDMLLGIYASRDMRANKVIEFGVIEARAFEIKRYEMKFALEGEHYIKFLNRKEEG